MPKQERKVTLLQFGDSAEHDVEIHDENGNLVGSGNFVRWVGFGDVVGGTKKRMPGVKIETLEFSEREPQAKQLRPKGTH